jgi:hypothetical protein
MRQPLGPRLHTSLMTNRPVRSSPSTVARMVTRSTVAATSLAVHNPFLDLVAVRHISESATLAVQVARCGGPGRGSRLVLAVDLEDAVGAGDAERLWILVALAEDGERFVSHLPVGPRALEHGSAGNAHRVVPLAGFEVGLG